MEKLFVRELGEGQPLIILHGLFGSSDNWLTLGRRFAEQFHVFLLDQRNHGQSFHDDVFNYPAMAADLEQFMDEKNIESAHILGHSMGGKTAMEFAIHNPERVEKLIVADIGPRAYPVHHSTILKGLFSIPLATLESRKQADELLGKYVPEMGVRQFLLKNLTREGGDFKWRINLPVIAEKIEEIGQGINPNAIYTKPAFFVRGERSDYIRDEDFDLIESIFTDCDIETISEAGHWLHAEKPQEFYDLVMDFLI